VADLYERARPGYPDEAVAYLASRLGLEPGRVVVDLAAGTGKLTRSLVPTGARVIAVEPLEEMRSVLAGLLPDVELLAATAESLPLADASVDAVTAAQAFHWFDPEPALKEIARVLRPGGALSLIWNIRDLSDPFQNELDDLLRAYRGEAPSEHERPWRALVDASPLFGPPEERSFRWVQLRTADELAERVASVSYVAQLADGEREGLLGRVRQLVAGLPEPFPFRHHTDVYVFPRSP
jgi:SAM-dependent methyltransferase